MNAVIGRKIPKMLKAAIIYPMGAGGNFITRLLTLSEKTIPLIRHEDISVDQVTLELTAQQRFDLYNYFNARDWRSAEYRIIMQYKWGHRDFYHYELSERFLIDSWHPHVFLDEDTRQVLWKKNTWSRVIFIDGDQQDRKFIDLQGKNKDYPPNTPYMYQCQDQLRAQFDNCAIDLPFKTLINESLFYSWLTQVNQDLELDLDMSLAMSLWTTWIEHSNECWFATTKFDRQNVYGQAWAPKIIKKC